MPTITSMIETEPGNRETNSMNPMTLPDIRELLPETNDARPAAEAWDASPFPVRRPLWKVQDRERTDNRSNTMKRALLEDPFVFFDPESLPELAAMAGESPETARNVPELAKKMVSARFLANAYDLDFPDAVQNFSALSEAFFGEKISDSRQVYQRLREIRRREEVPGLGERLGRDAAIGTLTALKSGGIDIPNELLFRPLDEVGNLLNYGVYKPLEWISRQTGWKWGEQTFGAQAYRRYTTLSGPMDELAENYRKEIAYQQKQRGPSSGFGEELASGVIQNFPNMLLTLTVAEAKVASSMSAASAYFGVSSFASELSDTRNDPDMSEFGKLANAVVVGSAEALFEEWHGFGRIARKYWGKPIPAGEVRKLSTTFGATLSRTAKALALDAAGEGWEEVETGAVQRFSNLLFHKDGKTLSGMSAGELFHELCDPMPLEFSVGSFMGGGMGLAGIGHRFTQQRTAAQIHNFRADLFREAQTQLETLRAKKSLSDGESRIVEKLDGAIRTGDAAALFDLADEQIRQEQKERRRDEMSLDEWAREISADALRQEKEYQAEQWRNTATERAPRLETVRNMVEELAAEYGGTLELEFARTVEELPEPIRNALNFHPGAEGCFDPETGKIWFIGSNLEPGRVKKVFLHEAVGHKGLREVFGAKYDVFLDKIARDFSDDVSAVADRRKIDFTTETGRLEAADEFMATLAETKTDNPALWKRLLAAFRAWFRTLPGFHELRYSDAELATLLSQSAKALSHTGGTHNALGMDGSRNPDIRFALANDPESGKAFPKRHAGNYSEALNNLRSIQGQTFVNVDTGIEARLSATGINKLLSNKAREKSHANGFTYAQHFEAISNIDRLFENAVLTEERGDRNRSTDIASIKRFSAPFYTGKEFAEAYITIKEIIEHGHRIYSLELDEIKKPPEVKKGVRPDQHTRPSDGTPPDTDADRTKHDPVDGGYNPKLLEKIEKSRQLLEKEGKKNDPDIRYSVSPEYSDRVKRLAALLAPHNNGTEMLEPEAAAALLTGAGIEIDPELDAKLLHDAAWQSRELVRERIKRTRREAEERHLRSKDSWYAALSEKYGPDFKIAPGEAYEGQSFTGTWIDHRKRSKNQIGIPLSEAAKTVSEAIGKPVSEAALMEYFGSLKRESLLADLREKKARLRELRQAEEQMTDEKSTSRLAERNRWLYDTYPFIRAAIDFGGESFTIKPSMRYDGEAFSGTYIASEWRKSSGRKRNGKNGADAIAAESRRLDRLNNAKGISSEELAQHIARETGGDPLEIEDRLISFFRDLKKTDLYREFYAGKREGAARERELNREAETMQEMQQGRERAESAAREFRALLDEAMRDKMDIVNIQSQAAAYARRHLPKELRGEFLQQIADLSRYTAEPSPAYPEGRRMYELEKLLSKMQTFRLAERTRELADRYKSTVNRTGQRIAPIGGEAQEVIDEIRSILRMPGHAVANRIAELSEQLNAAISEENSELADKLTESLELLRLFGRLEQKTQPEALEAFQALDSLISDRKDAFLAKLHAKREELGRKRHAAVMEITGNRDGLPQTGRADREPKRNRWLLMQRNLRALLELATNRSDKEFEETEFGKLYGKLESSTWKNATLDRESNTRAEQAVERIFRLDTLPKKAAFWREAEKVEEHTGIFIDRYSRPVKYAENHFGLADGRGFYTASITPEGARKLLQNITEGKAELDPVAAEFLQQQLDDFEHGVEQEWQIFGNPDEDAAFNTFVKQQRRENRLTIFRPDPKAEKRRTELQISRADGATLLMAWEQPDVQARMRWNGWTDESIEQLKKFIGRDFTEFAYWSRQDIADTSKALDAASRAIYGAGLPGLRNYYPVSYKESLGKKIGSGKTESYLGYGYGQMSVNPSFLIKRRFHLSDVDLHRSIFQAHLQHQLEVNHFLAWGESIREARGILNDKRVRQAVSATYGSEVYNQIIDRVKVLANAGRDSGQAVELMGRLFRYWVPSKIALNFSSVLKQFAGSAAYMNEIPVKDFLANFAETFTGSAEFRKFVDYAMKSDYFKDRIQGGFSRDIMYLMKSNRSGKIADVYGNALIDKGTYLTRWSDSVSALRGGYAVFKYHYGNLISRGMEPGAAWELAAQKWRRATDETQQSGYLKDQNRFQSDAGAWRYLTSFLSNPIQIMNLELMTIDDIRFGTGRRKAEAWKKLPRQLFVNHVVLPTLMTLITQLFRNGFDYDEYEWQDYATASLLGPFEGAFIAGKVLQSVADTIGGRILGSPSGPWQSVAEAFPMFDESITGLERLLKLASDDQPDGDEYYRAVQGLADILAAAGTVFPLPYAGAGGAMGSAFLRELKRLRRLFGPAESGKPKLKF